MVQLLIILAIVSAGALPPPNATWRTIAPESERFTVSMPGQPVSDSAGAVTVHVLEWGGYRLSVMSVREPRIGALPLDEALAVFAARYEAAFREEIRADVNADPLEFRGEITLGGAIGREYNVASPLGPGLLRMYMTASDIYVVAAIGGDDRDSTVRRFIDSFSLREEMPPAATGLLPGDPSRTPVDVGRACVAVRR